MKTRAPSSASVSAHARPRPLLAAVTSARRPLRPRSIYAILALLWGPGLPGGDVNRKLLLPSARNESIQVLIPESGCIEVGTCINCDYGQSALRQGSLCLLERCSLARHKQLPLAGPLFPAPTAGRATITSPESPASRPASASRCAYDYGALIESWNGTSWSIVPAPDSGISGLSSVACPSSSFCSAVGG